MKKTKKKRLRGREKKGEEKKKIIFYVNHGC
jgi:hypothetical protein